MKFRVSIASLVLLLGVHFLEAMDGHDQKKVIIPRLKTKRSGSIVLSKPDEAKTPRSPSTLCPQRIATQGALSAPTTARASEQINNTQKKQKDATEDDAHQKFKWLGLSPRSQSDANRFTRKYEGYRSPLSPRARSTSTGERELISGSDDESSDDDDKTIFITPDELHKSDKQQTLDEIVKCQEAKKRYMQRLEKLDTKMATLIGLLSKQQ